jgi:hypothetical protein
LTSSRRANKDHLSRAIVILLISGVLALLFSIFYEVTTLAFVGLGLTFWGVLFLILGPVRQIDSNLIHNEAISEYSTIERIIRDFKYTGEAFYIPPYPKNVYIPEHLKSLKDAVVYISAKENNRYFPSNEEKARGKFLLENQQGILITPPGLGIITEIEQKSNVNFANMKINQLCQTIPQTIIENLNLVKEIDIAQEENIVKAKISNSVYQNLYRRESNAKSIRLLGCPLVSAIAIALSKATNKNINIIKENISPDNLTIEIWYKINQN